MYPHQFFATCPRGLEDLLAEDLKQAGAGEVSVVHGGVGFAGDWQTCYRVNLESRIATRVLWRVGNGAYTREEDIYRLAYDLSWAEWFTADQTIRVYLTAIRSPLKSIDFITLRIKDALCDRFRADCGKRPSVDSQHPDIRIHAFLTAGEATLYVDTSGEPLYKRGLKSAMVEAPLKENLAAGILRLSSWRTDEPLLDPMCGSGTFLLEAARMALNIAPGLQRSFGFEKLKNFDATLWQELLDQARARQHAPTPLPIYGSDLFGEQISRARENLTAAGLGEVVQLKQANVLELPPPASTGVLVTNPPYGVRLSDHLDLETFYPQLGDALKKKFAGWRCYLLSADNALPKLIGLKASRRTPLYNGALECRLYEYTIVAGAMRRDAGKAG